MGQLRKKETIDERLTRLNRELDKSLRKHQNATFAHNISNLDRLVGFGLTAEEAKHWLEHEPNFVSSDGSYHGKKPDDKLPEPMLNLYIGGLKQHHAHQRTDQLCSPLHNGPMF